MGDRADASGSTMIARPVVSNASPIIALDEIGRLSLMQQLFGTVLIPPAVAVEVAPSVTLPPWIEQRALTQAIGPMVLRASLTWNQGCCSAPTTTTASRVGASMP